MATFNKFDCFAKDLADGIHNLTSDQLGIALCASNHQPSTADDTTIGDLQQINYTYLLPADRYVTTVSSAEVSGEYVLQLQDLSLTASGGTVDAFRYIILYNDDAGLGTLIGWADYGSNLQLTDGSSFNINFAEDTITIDEAS